MAWGIREVGPAKEGSIAGAQIGVNEHGQGARLRALGNRMSLRVTLPEQGEGGAPTSSNVAA